MGGGQSIMKQFKNIMGTSNDFEKELKNKK